MEDGTLVDDDYSFVDSSEDLYEDLYEDLSSEDVTVDSEFSAEASRRPQVVGGVDDERENIRGFCPIKVDPIPDLHNLYSPLECARSCNDREKPRICYYHFEVEYYSALSR